MCFVSHLLFPCKDDLLPWVVYDFFSSQSFYRLEPFFRRSVANKFIRLDSILLHMSLLTLNYSLFKYLIAKWPDHLVFTVLKTRANFFSNASVLFVVHKSCICVLFNPFLVDLGLYFALYLSLTNFRKKDHDEPCNSSVIFQWNESRKSCFQWTNFHSHQEMPLRYQLNRTKWTNISHFSTSILFKSCSNEQRWPKKMFHKKARKFTMKTCFTNLTVASTIPKIIITN